MIYRLLHTDADHTLTWLRVIGAGVMFAHGAQKVLGWFGGTGFDQSLQGLTGMGIPEPLAVVAIATEFFGALALMAGLLGRIAALGIAIEMVVAIFLVHLRNGFFMNWMGNAPGEGFEYHLLLIGLIVPVVFRGSGAWSIDHWLARRWTTHHSGVGELRGAHAH